MYNELWSISCVLFLLGFLFMAVGSIWRFLLQQDETFQGSAEARVVDIRTEPRTGEASLSEFRNRQAAVFEFYAGGRPVKVTDPSDAYPCPYRLNQRIRIRYDLQNPEHFYVEEKNRKKQLAGAAHTLGVGCIAGGCVLFFLYAGGVRI